MSEHQYHEFLAIDRRLTPEQMQELRACSTRATITPTSFVNHYNFGDLKASPEDWMRRYFDAHLYYANWGTRSVMLRLPKTVFDARLLARYCGGGSASVRVAGQHAVLSFRFEPDDGDRDEDITDLWRIAPVRDELATGDHRALYVGWLLRLQSGEVDDTTAEPPCPPGMGDLSPAVTALAEFLCIDGALLRAAAEGSAPLSAPSPNAMRAGIRALPVREKDRLLLRVAEGDHAAVRAALFRAAPTRKTGAKYRARTAAALIERAGIIAPRIEAPSPAQRIRWRMSSSRDIERRSQIELDAVTARLLQEIAREGGRGIEHIARDLGVGTRELMLPVRRLLVSGAIRTQGRKRATKYFAVSVRGKR